MDEGIQLQVSQPAFVQSVSTEFGRASGGRRPFLSAARQFSLPGKKKVNNICCKAVDSPITLSLSEWSSVMVMQQSPTSSSR